MLAHDLARKLLEGPNVHVVAWEGDDEAYLPTGDLKEVEVWRWNDYPDRSFRQMEERKLGGPPGINVVAISFSSEENKEWFKNE